MVAPVEFGLFVRSVTGHAVPRYGSSELIGAERVALSREQKNAGESAIVWSKRIVPLSAVYCRQYTRELEQHLAAKELRRCTREEWESQCAADATAAAEAEAAALPPDSPADAAEKADQ